LRGNKNLTEICLAILLVKNLGPTGAGAFAFCSNFELLHLRAIICNNLTSHTGPKSKKGRGIASPEELGDTGCSGRIHMSICIFMSNIFYKHHCAYWIKNKLKIQKYSLAAGKQKQSDA